jgi:hypothetical protein
MSNPNDSKGGGQKKDGKRRIVIRLPPGSILNTMSEDEITKHIHDLGGKTGINRRQLGGPVDELVVEVADSSLPTTSSSSADLAPPPGWAARWSRKCSV